MRDTSSPPTLTTCEALCQSRGPKCKAWVFLDPVRNKWIPPPAPPQARCCLKDQLPTKPPVPHKGATSGVLSAPPLQQQAQKQKQAQKQGGEGGLLPLPNITVRVWRMSTSRPVTSVIRRDLNSKVLIIFRVSKAPPFRS